ncbi:MAG: TlpA family protein disulfide reductase [Prevotella sp.]|jgi:thiol-disulfide isomerase/thioredoxin|nr:TlpA family protein disulfide reductase [Prevotella sp.]
MKKTEFKRLAVFCIVSLLILIITSPIRGGYIPISFLTGPQQVNIVGFLIYFAITFYFLSKYGDIIRPYKIFLAMIIGISLLQLPATIILFDSTKGSRSGYIIHLSAILFAYISYKVKKKYRYIICVVCILCGMWLSVCGENYWNHKIDFGTFTGKLSEKEVYNLKFQTEEGDTLSIDDFKGQYVVIDCWYTYCGVCYKKFPKVQELYDKYKDSERVALYSIHSRIVDRKENFKTGTNILKEEGYTFPSFSIDIDDPILNQLGVDVYPTVLIFDKDSKLIFRGNIESAEKLIEKLGR